MLAKELPVARLSPIAISIYQRGVMGLRAGKWLGELVRDNAPQSKCLPIPTHLWPNGLGERKLQFSPNTGNWSLVETPWFLCVTETMGKAISETQAEQASGTGGSV